MHDNRKFENVGFHVQRMVKLAAGNHLHCYLLFVPLKKRKKFMFEVRTAFYLFYIIFSREMLTIKSLSAR